MPEPWDTVATLIDPSRRALFEYVRGQDHPVGREEAAAATAMSRGLAAFHLDKLVDAGLLAARYEAPSGPRGRGRTPKVYVAVTDGVAVAVPARRDDLIADVLAEAYRQGEDPERVAYRRGREHGPDDLARLGFAPHRDGDLILLGNCPFHALTTRHGALICGIALAFLGGVAAGVPGYAAGPSPRPGGCCVALTESRPPSPD